MFFVEKIEYADMQLLLYFFWVAQLCYPRSLCAQNIVSNGAYQRRPLLATVAAKSQRAERWTTKALINGGSYV